MVIGSVNIYDILRPNLLWMKAVSRRLTLRFVAYCALLAMICQLLLPFAHTAVMQADVNPAWCGTGVKAPSASLNLGSEQGDHAAKMMFCPVCAAASVHAIAPPPAAAVLLLAQPFSAIQLPTQHTHFAYQSYAIPPPPRGPPEFLNV
jgi:hypothetical protein